MRGGLAPALWLVLVLVLGASWFGVGGAGGADGEKKRGGYEAIEVRDPVFVGDEVGMLGQERQELAGQLASYVVNTLADGVLKGDGRAAALAGRLLGVALNLDPRNRVAVVANFQLGRGLKPTEVEAGYSAEVLSQLLVARAQFLRAEGGAANVLLAGYFLALAVELFPRNEDAVYEWEIYRLDEAPLEWKLVTGR